MTERILLVDDDIAEISAVKRVLHRAGLHPTLATNSTDALATIEQAPPDLVVIAPECENGGGAALARDLAVRSAARAIPLILLGPVDGDGIGAEILARPIDSAHLERAVREALERKTALPAPLAVAAPERSLGDERRRYELQVAELERAAAEQEAIRELRRAELAPVAPGDDVQAAAETAVGTADEAAADTPVDIAGETAADAAAQAPRGAPQPSPEVLSGSLSQISMPRWLAHAAREHATGALEVGAEPRRVLWLEEGRVVGADSSAPGERAEEIALRLGLLTREQREEALPRLAGLGSRSVASLLLDRGFLRPAELGLLARRRAEEIAFTLFTLEAPYRFEPGARVPPDERLELERGTLALAVEGVQRRWTSPRLDALLGGGATLLAPSAHHPPFADLALSPEERRVGELADGLRTVDEIMAGAPLDALSSRQVLAALVEVGALEVKVRAPRETPAAAPPPASIDVLRLREKLEQVRRADYFVILGLGRGCTGYEVREAAARLLSDLTMERFASHEPNLAGDAREVRRVVEEARDVLADDELRAKYSASLGD